MRAPHACWSGCSDPPEFIATFTFFIGTFTDPSQNGIVHLRLIGVLSGRGPGMEPWRKMDEKLSIKTAMCDGGPHDEVRLLGADYFPGLVYLQVIDNGNTALAQRNEAIGRINKAGAAKLGLALLAWATEGAL